MRDSMLNGRWPALSIGSNVMCVATFILGRFFERFKSVRGHE